MATDAYFDMRNLNSARGASGSCPVSGCAAPLEKAPSRWGEMPYCLPHCIRIHASTRTFVYYNGKDETSKRNAALRNILFERDYFRNHMLGNAAKAETHRICHETSEDALTWNVFSRLARAGMLPRLLSTFTRSSLKNEPELYLWGLRVRLDDSSAPILFPALKYARDTFEKGINRFLTEPDIMLYVPGQLLILVEAKFTSGNTVAPTSATHEPNDEKPKSRSGILRRYPPTELPYGMLLAPSSANPFYSQLYRNLFFAMHMATELGTSWGLVNLVCEKQFNLHHGQAFRDPTQSISAHLPGKSREQFHFYNWERLYSDHVAKVSNLGDLGEYMRNKSANGVEALALR